MKQKMAKKKKWIRHFSHFTEQEKEQETLLGATRMRHLLLEGFSLTFLLLAVSEAQLKLFSSASYHDIGENSLLPPFS